MTRTQRAAGTPYTDEMIAAARSDFRAQADPDAGDPEAPLARHPKAVARNFDGAAGVSELDAVIAYLRMLGALVDFSTFESDQIWLHGGAFDQIHGSVTAAGFGVMPAFGGRLPPPAIREVAIQCPHPGRRGIGGWPVSRAARRARDVSCASSRTRKGARRGAGAGPRREARDLATAACEWRS